MTRITQYQPQETITSDMGRDLSELIANIMPSRPNSKAVRDCEILKRRSTNSEKRMGRPPIVKVTKEGKV